MAQEYAHTAAFRGARFTESDLNGATFRDCDLRNVRITSSAVDGMHISGFDGRAGTVVVDDVVVTDFVAAELDRRHPERVQLRAMRTADDFRTMWATLEGLWADTLARAELLPEDLRHERVNDEWSLVQVRTGTAMPGMDDELFTVGTCLRVVLNEHSAHRRYAVRDLAVLEARTSTPT